MKKSTKRSLSLLPIMALTLGTLVLGGCDENKAEDTAAAEQTQVAPEATPEAAVVAPVTVIQTMDAKAFATAPGMTNGAVFVTLQNPGMDSDKLVGATSDIVPMVELHETSMDSTTGTMQMRKVDAIEIPAGQSVTLSPDGFHIMLMGLAAPLTEGQTFNVTLDFEKAADAVVPVMVTAAGAPAAPAAETSAPAPMDHSTHGQMPTPDAAMKTPAATPIVPDAAAPAVVAPTTEAPTMDESPAAPTVQ